MFVGYDGPVEAEENRSQICLRPFTRIRLEFRLDVNDEGGADRRE